MKRVRVNTKILSQSKILTNNKRQTIRKSFLTDEKLKKLFCSFERIFLVPNSWIFSSVFRKRSPFRRYTSSTDTRTSFIVLSYRNKLGINLLSLFVIVYTKLLTKSQLVFCRTTFFPYTISLLYYFFNSKILIEFLI